MTLSDIEVKEATLPKGWFDNRFSKRADAKRKTTANRAKLWDRPMIAWDGEGIKLSGQDKPQHYVLFGCSAEPETALRTYLPKDSLGFVQMADYMCAVSARYPGAFHVGYFFGYDQNMIVRDLPWRIKQRIYENGSARYTAGNVVYRISVVWGKKIRITRIPAKGNKVSILVEDFAAFFACSFIAAYRKMFPDADIDPAFHKVVEGKAMRADTTWLDMPVIREYWTHEIIAVQRLAEQFRKVMYNAGFMLSQWYGPGALASYIRRDYRLIEHEWGGKHENMPAPVQEAVKSAFYGGHFELYKIGRIEGPIWAYDINSAYPAAFTKIPTLREGGFWVQIAPQDLDRVIRKGSFAVFKLRFVNPRMLILDDQPQPLPHRDRTGTISYPPMTTGWYWHPEAAVAVSMYPPEAVELLDGWQWLPADDTYPWADVLGPMYQKRLALKAAGDPSEMALKLGPNSIYGKMAQRVGWDKVKRTPPRSHTLPLAGYVTSRCRASIMHVMRKCPPESTIAVETDAVFSLMPPEHMQQIKGFTIGTGLGEWSVSRYDRMLWLQNGFYMGQRGDEWVTLKTRGFARSHFLDDNGGIDERLFVEYLSSCYPGEPWKELSLPVGERFIGIGAAIGRSRSESGGVNPFKAGNLHCRWSREERQIELGVTGKRVHSSRLCNGCEDELTANDGMHDLVVRSQAFLQPVSATYQMPWETDFKEESWRSVDTVARHLITE